MTLQQPALKSAPTVAVPIWTEHIAQAVSQIGSPPLLSVASALLCAYVLGTATDWLWAGVHCCISVALPTLYIIWLVRRGQVTDIHLRVREQRIRPLLVSIGAQAFSTLVLLLGGASTLLLLLAGLGLVQLVIFLGITLKWKISVHCAAASGLSVLGWALIGTGGVVIALTVPLIAWSRVHLNRHTLSQAMAGAALGTGLWVAALLAYGA